MQVEKIKKTCSPKVGRIRWGASKGNRIWGPMEFPRVNLNQNKSENFLKLWSKKIKILHRKGGTNMMERDGICGRGELQTPQKQKPLRIFWKWGRKNLNFAQDLRAEGTVIGNAPPPQKKWAKNSKIRRPATTTSERENHNFSSIRQYEVKKKPDGCSTDRHTYAYTRRIHTQTHICTRTTPQQTVAYWRSCTYIHTRTHKDLAKTGRQKRN